MALISIDRSAHPIIKVRFPESGDVEDIRRYYRELEQLLKEGHDLAFLVDFRKTKAAAISSTHRKAAALCFTPIKELFEKHTIAEAMVFPNSAMRAVYIAFHWILEKQVDCERKSFSNEAKALLWLEQRVARHCNEQAS